MRTYGAKNSDRQNLDFAKIPTESQFTKLNAFALYGNSMDL